MVFLYILGAIALIQGILSLRDGISAARHIQTFRPKRTANPSVVVFCPCKGAEPEFEKNIQSILEQDYPTYQVKFVVDSDDDEAYERLRKMGIAGVLVAGRASNCGQKVHNLAYAVRHTAKSADVYVFCDSDARFQPQWLSKLVAPLAANTVTTGYRWYVVDRFHLPTILRSAWNASVVTLLGDHDRNFAWGGSMAIERAAFEKLGILEAWRGSVSDDYAVTRAAQRAGVKIVFVPECLAPSYGACTWAELLEFTTRQITITRVYYPRLWRVGFIGQAIFNASLFGLLFSLPSLSFLIYLLSAAKSWVRLRAVRSVVPPWALPRHAWFYILLSPLVALLYLYNMVRSALATDIVWRQIRYRLISPNETEIF